MAENLDITIDDNGVTPTKSGKKKLLLIPLILLVLAVQTVAAYYTVQYLFFSHAAPKTTQSSEVAAADSAAVEEHKAESSEASGETAEELYEIKDIIVNPSGTLGRRYFVLSMGLEVSNAHALEELKAKDAIIRDALITLLTQKSLDYISDVLNMENIRTEIMQTVNEKLQKGKVAKVYFTSYILQ